jgi:hypothetical protein
LDLETPNQAAFAAYNTWREACGLTPQSWGDYARAVESYNQALLARERGDTSLGDYLDRLTGLENAVEKDDN